MVKQRDGHKFVCVSPTISDGEEDFVMQRKRRIQKWLSSQNVECELEDVPHIALLGSGGGERAAVGLLGSLMQLGQDDMLDSLLYMCGVSGSTWCMASLYKDPEWSENGERAQEVIKTLGGPAVSFNKAVSWLRGRKREDPDFSLTDMWAALVTSMFMKELDSRLLSSEAHRDGTNPYPIYTAIERDRNHEENAKGVWFEITPHESGFSGLDAFVSTSYLRSEFDGGVLIQKRPEMDMVLLQGTCGSALADGQRNIKEITSKLWQFLKGNKEGEVVEIEVPLTGSKGDENGPDTEEENGFGGGECACAPSQVVRGVSDLIEYGDDPEAQLDDRKILHTVHTLGQLLEGKLNSSGERLWKMDDETWQRSSMKKRRAFIDAISSELIHHPEWAEGWEDQSCDCNGSSLKVAGSPLFSTLFSSWLPRPRSDAAWVIKNIFPLVRQWDWGTTSNFLYHCKDSNLPSGLVKEKKVHLVDAGLKINSPYPPVLRPGREVDLIISLDFSAGDPFETLFSAKEYAKKMHLPFPKVAKAVDDDKDHPDGCYVFQSRSAAEPTVMHMPLFNLQNCEGEEGIMKMREEFRTFRRSYSAEQLQLLVEKAQENVRNARQQILHQIKAAVLRRRARNAAPMDELVVSSVQMSRHIEEPAPLAFKSVAPPEPVVLRASKRAASPEPAPRAPKRAAPVEEAPLAPLAPLRATPPAGYYLMPIGPTSVPFGPIGMQPCPQMTPGFSGWLWGGQQSPAQMQAAPPTAPAQLPAMPFPGYYMMPNFWPLPAYSAP